MRAWMRQLTVTFTSQLFKKSMTFGNNRLNGKDDFNINVKIYKYMATRKDEATIQITNLTYAEVIQIMQGQFYDVEIKAGYDDIGARTVFKGGILYITNSKSDRKENVINIKCGSQLVARYCQSRIKFSLNSGINMYSAINYVCKKSGIPNSNVSPQLKKNFIEDVISENQTPSSYIDSLLQNNDFLIANSDSSDSSFLTLFNSKWSNSRVYRLDKNTSLLVGGYPTLVKEGLTFSTLPTINYMCGDTIVLDNSLIVLNPSDSKGQALNAGYYLDKDGKYMVYQIEYDLQNRGANFSCKLYCKARGLISNYIGGV